MFALKLQFNLKESNLGNYICIYIKLLRPLLGGWNVTIRWLERSQPLYLIST